MNQVGSYCGSSPRVSVVRYPSDVKQEAHLNYVMVPMWLKNDLAQPLIRGCYVGLTDRNNTLTQVIVADVPIKFEVQGNQEF